MLLGVLVGVICTAHERNLQLTTDFAFDGEGVPKDEENKLLKFAACDPFITE